jgi:hypothetical protein
MPPSAGAAQRDVSTAPGYSRDASGNDRTLRVESIPKTAQAADRMSTTMTIHSDRDRVMLRSGLSVSPTTATRQARAVPIP